MTISDLLAFVKKHKRAVNSINYLKFIWGHKDEANPILKCVRILSFVFLRKYCLSYVFNSRVKNYMTHVKYRRRITEGLLTPEEFTCIKQFWSYSFLNSYGLSLKKSFSLVNWIFLERMGCCLPSFVFW